MPTEHVGPRGLRRLLEATVLVGSDLELHAVLQRVVEAAVELVDARYGALGVLHPDRNQLADFITVGIDEPTRQAIGPLPKGLGLLGTLIADAQALRLADLHEHPASVGFPPGHPPMQSFIGVPIRLRDEVFGNLYLTEKQSGEAFTDIDEELTLGLASAAAVAIENARLFDQVRRREATLAAMNEVSVAVLAGVDVDESLELVANRVRLLVGGELATVALPTSDGERLDFKVVDGPLTAEIVGRSFPTRGSVSGEVLRSGNTVVMEDASLDHRVSQPQVRTGHLGPAVWVPLVSGGRPFGTLSISRSAGSPMFSPSEIETIESFANQASIILEQNRAREALQRIVVIEDQERIARDLHDTVIQRLFAIGMSLQATMRVVTDSGANDRLSRAVDELDITIRHIRTVIFGLESESSATRASVRSRVLEISTEAARVLGFQPSVSFAGPIETSGYEAITDELLSTLREALSNVARHAKARRVTIEVVVDGDALRLVVEDDGIGIDLETSGAAAGRGIKNMGSRAQRHGGSMVVGPALNGGTRLVWSLPLRSGTDEVGVAR